jgi:hypothetical protein
MLVGFIITGLRDSDKIHLKIISNESTKDSLYLPCQNAKYI